MPDENSFSEQQLRSRPGKGIGHLVSSPQSYAPKKEGISFHIPCEASDFTPEYSPVSSSKIMWALRIPQYEKRSDLSLFLLEQMQKMQHLRHDSLLSEIVIPREKILPKARLSSPLSVPHYAVKKEISVIISPSKKKIAQKKSLKKTTRKPGFLGEVFRFAITTVSIFAIGQLVLNAPAYSEMLMARINPEKAQAEEDALRQVVKNHAPILPTAGMKRENRRSIPPLHLSVAPLENRIVIPKIGKNIPLNNAGQASYENGDWDGLEQDIQTALQDGVVRYPGTAEPGDIGNVFVTGHSSYYLWDPGRYKDVFARLHDLEVGDEFTIYWNQEVHHYRIATRKVVTPEETSVLDQPHDKKVATLMTCTPVGTTKNRLIFVAEEIEKEST